jgi:hypothetical protein
MRHTPTHTQFLTLHGVPDWDDCKDLYVQASQTANPETPGGRIETPDPNKRVSDHDQVQVCLCLLV